MNISTELLDEVIAHVSEDPENERCGVVATRQSSTVAGAPPRAVRVYRATNIHASPLKFEIDPPELLRLWDACHQDGCELGAIYHSHVRSEPYPSQTDINFASNWPGVEWIIVGLRAAGAPEVRSYVIEGGEVKEVTITQTQV